MDVGIEPRLERRALKVDASMAGSFAYSRANSIFPAMLNAPLVISEASPIGSVCARPPAMANPPLPVATPPLTVDPEILQGSPQQSAAIERVRSEIEGKPRLFAGCGASARRGRPFDDDDRDAAAAEERGADEARQPRADDDDWRFAIGDGSHISITFD